MALPMTTGFVPGTSSSVLALEVELTISARNLLNSDAFSKSDPMCVVFVQPFAQTWQEHGRTEVLKNCLNPEFATKIRMSYFFEEQQKLKFKFYDVDSSDPSLAKQDFLGDAECTLGQIVSASTYETGLMLNGRPVGNMVVMAEEVGNCKEELELAFSGAKLKKSGLFSLPDPFLAIYREASEASGRTLLYRTPYIPDTRNPTWPKFALPMRLLKTSDDKGVSLILQCSNYNQNGSHKLIGEVNVQSNELMDAPRTLSLRNAKYGTKETGQLNLVSSQVKTTDSHSFLEYVMGGTQLNCTFAIDFTASNGKPTNANSLHHTGVSQNFYELAIRYVGDIIQDYDSDKQFPVLGFGALLPPDGKISHEFFVNMSQDNPYCAGVDGVLQAYRNCLYQIQLCGPTNFAPVINHVARFAAAYPDGSNYFVLLIITDGAISDMTHTKQAIIRASSLPLSIIIVGVGNADFASMNELDSDNKVLSVKGLSASRDIVQFVAFSEFLHKSQNDPVAASYHLAKALLAEIPHQFVSYMKSRNIVPKRVTH